MKDNHNSIATTVNTEQSSHVEKIKEVSQIQIEIMEVITSVLGEDISSIDTSQPLGAIVSSLQLVEGVKLIKDKFDVNISIIDLLSGQANLYSLISQVEESILCRQQVKSKINLESNKSVEKIRLAPSQHHIEFLSRYSQGASAAYNENLIVRLNGRLELSALKLALLNLRERYVTLRSGLGEHLFEVEVKQSKDELQVENCSVEQLEKTLSDIVQMPFSIGATIFRVRLLKICKDEHVLILVGHQLILDQSDLSYIMNGLSTCYNKAIKSQVMSTVQFDSLPGISARLDDSISIKVKTEAVKYWSTIFSKQFDYLNLPECYARPPVKDYQGQRLLVSLEKSLQENIESWSVNNDSSIFDTVLCAYSLMLHRLTSQSTILLGVGKDSLTKVSEHRDITSVNSIRPVRFSYDATLNFGEYVARQKLNLEASAQHNIIPLIDIVRIADIPRDLSRSGLVSAVFNSNNVSSLPVFSDLNCSYLASPTSGARYDIEMTLVYDEKQNKYKVCCDYDSNIYSHEIISSWINTMLSLLEAGVDHNTKQCGFLPVFSTAEKTLILNDWNETEKAYPKDKTIVDLVMLQVETRTNNLAIESEQNQLTYNELGQRIDFIARILFNRGIRHGDCVAVLMERVPDMVATMLAVWRLGATLLPLDPSFPEHRIQLMLSDSKTRLLVVCQNHQEKFNENSLCDTLLVDSSIQIQSCTGFEAYFANLETPSLSHLIYTSGSTGQPKGIKLLHSGVINTLLAVKDLFKFTQDSKWLAITTINFDISIVELFLPLITGGILNIADSKIAGDGVKLVEKIETCQPTHIQATPSTWKTMVQAGWKDKKEYLNCMISTGEALPADLSKKLIGYCENLWNMYGPSETTIFSSAYHVALKDDDSMRIGRPLANNTIYILDSLKQPVPIGVVGELYIGGDGVCDGYLNSQLNKEFFVSHPFSSQGLLYKTGDLAKYLHNGDLVYLGRNDHQVKKNGVRIELAEIEVALKKNKSIVDVVVTTWEKSNGHQHFVAHVVPTDKTKLTDDEIREDLSQWLPAVMIPAYYLFHDHLPLTPNKKIDKNQLPTPCIENSYVTDNFQEPVTETEISLVKIWAKILDLQIDSIDRNADFISLGGHSLLMTPLMVEVKNIFNVQFTLQSFFNAKTLRSFANLIDEEKNNNTKELKQQQHTEELRKTEWAKQRMAFLERESHLPPNLTPARGMEFSKPEKIKTVFLTGATGFLGAFILGDMLCSSDAEVYCLVRHKRGQDAKKRIERQLKDFNIWDDSDSWQQAWNSRVKVIEGDISLPRMGITDTSYSSLAYEADVVIHSAAQVNFIYPYEAISAANVRGVQEIIRFAFFNRIKQVHFLSTAAIWPMGAGSTYLESDTIDHGQQLRLGYYEAKWVAEKCLLEAANRGLPVTIHRPGEIGGDSIYGKCILEHFMIALTKGFLQVGAFPIIDSVLDVAPVDYVAKAIVYLVFHGKTIGKSFHLTNPSSCHMNDALLFLKELGYDFQELQFSELRDLLLSQEKFSDNALFPFQAALESMNEEHLQLPNYDCQQTLKELENSGVSCPPLDKKLLGTYIKYLQSIDYIPLPNK